MAVFPFPFLRFFYYLKLMGFFQYKVSPSASFHWCTCFPIMLTVVLYLLEAEVFVTCRQREAPSRCLPAAGPSSPPGLAYKRSLLRFFCSFTKSESWALWGKRTQIPRSDCKSGVVKGSGGAPAAWLRRYRIVTVSVDLRLSILCLKWLPKREHIWCNITLGYDKRVVSKNYNLEHEEVPLTFS